MDKQAIKPGRWYYGLAALIFVIGGSLFVLLLLKNLSGITEGLIQVIVPGEYEITLSEVGKYTIFYEYRSVVDNEIYATERQISGLQCALTSQETEAQIELSPPSTNSRYTLGGRAGYSVLTFSIEKPGNYQFSAWYSEGQGDQEVVLAIGQGFMKKLMGTIFGGIAIMFGTVAVTIVIVTMTLVKRRKARRQLEDLG
jgi:hypothetical protein